VPFDFLRRKKPEEAPKAAATEPAGPARPSATIRFDGLTEEWRLVGQMHIEGRLSDVLNKRAAVPISDVSWAPIDGSGKFASVPGLKSVDPYDLILVFAGSSSSPPMSEAEKAGFMVHKVPYDVGLEAPPFRVVGTVYMLPGAEPRRLLERGTEMFVPAVGAVAWLGDKRLNEEDVDAILVNRFYLRAVELVDKRTGERVQPLPGAPLGGTSWQDKSR
jgi:hypothetical protein